MGSRAWLPSRGLEAVHDGSDDPAVVDAALARAFREGDPRAAGELFDRHAALVRRILARTLGPFCDLEDQVQDTFIAFFRQLRGLRNDRAVRAFLVSVAVRTARHELRRRRVRRVLLLSAPQDVPEVPGGDAVADIEGREALRRLFRILDDLDTPSRLAFTLRHLEDMELVEIAEVLEESLASVKRRLGRVVPVVSARVARDPALAAYVQGAAR